MHWIATRAISPMRSLSLDVIATLLISILLSTSMRRVVTISGILGIPLVNLTGCEIRFVF
jgi:hypothetical protein